MWWWLPARAEPFLPLEAIAVDLDVTGPVARLEVTERFRNTTPALIDALYVFPLARGAAIDGLHIRIGTREIVGVVQERVAARQAFERARDEGRTAALTEQLTSDVFTQDVANLPPGEAIEVTLSVVVPIERVDGRWTLVVPLAAPPRFVPLGAEPRLDTVSGRDTGVRADVSLTVQAGTAVRELTAGPLPRDVRPDLLGSSARLTLDDLPLGVDLVVGWSTARDLPAAALLTTPTHVLVVAEDGATAPAGPEVDWTRCPVADVVELPARGARYLLARRQGACAEVGVGGLAAWPRAAVDPHTLEASWARGVASTQPHRTRALGLQYGIVTSETSLVAVDSAGPVRSAPQPPPDPWAVTGWYPDGRVVDTSSTSHGVQLTREFLQRVPSGRSYQAATQRSAGVLAGSGGNPNLAGGATDDNTYVLDGVEISGEAESNLLVLGSEGGVVARRGFPALPTLGWSPPGDDVPLSVAATGLWSGASGGAVAATTAGSLAPGLRGGATFGWDQRPSGALVQREAGAWASTRDDLVANGSARAGDLGPRSWGELAGHAGHTRGGHPVALVASRRWLDGARADVASLQAGTGRTRDASALEASGELGGSALTADGALTRVISRWGVAGDTARGWVELAGGVALEQVGARALPEPRLALAVGRPALRLRLDAAREVDAERVLPRDRSAVAPVDDHVALALTGSGGLDWTVSASLAHTAYPLTLPLALDPLPAGPLPTVERTAPVLAAGLGSVGGRARASLAATLRPTAASLIDALALDPRAPFVPGHLDGLRRWDLSAEAWWDLPTDPATLSLGAFARWASAISTPGPWWTGPVRSVGGTARQRVPLGERDAWLTLGAAWIEADVARLPVPLQALLPGGLPGDEVSGLRAEASLAVDF